MSNADPGRLVPVHASGPGAPHPKWVGPQHITWPRSRRGALLALPSHLAVAVGSLSFDQPAPADMEAEDAQS